MTLFAGGRVEVFEVVVDVDGDVVDVDEVVVDAPGAGSITVVVVVVGFPTVVCPGGASGAFPMFLSTPPTPETPVGGCVTSVVVVVLEGDVVVVVVAVGAGKVKRNADPEGAPFGSTPPNTSTLPSGRSVAVCPATGRAMFGPSLH